MKSRLPAMSGSAHAKTETATHGSGAMERLQGAGAGLAAVAATLLAACWNLWATRAELTSVVRPNDTSVHKAMVEWARDRISAGSSPTDGWFPELAMGLPQFHHYQSLPHLISAYLATWFGTDRIVEISNWLLWGTWPIAVYLGARLLGLDRLSSAAAAVLSPLVANVDFYGFEMGSYLWRGNGLWSQVWAMWLMPIALGASVRFLNTGRNAFLAVGTVASVAALHFLTGYLTVFALVMISVFSGGAIVPKVRRLAVLGISTVAANLWILLPLYQDRAFSGWSEFNVGSVYLDSLGAREVVTRLWNGDVFDAGRFPTITLLAGLGILVALARRRRSPGAVRALPFAFLAAVLFYFGRPTWGSLIDLIPGVSEIVLHRILGLVHLLGLFLAGIGASYLLRHIVGFLETRFRAQDPSAQAPGERAGGRQWSAGFAVGMLVCIGVSVLAIRPAMRERTAFADLNGTWIGEQADAEALDLLSLRRLESTVLLNGDGRIWAGSSGSGVFGGTFAIGQVPIFMYMLNDGIDQIGFYLRTVSINGDPEAMFDPGNPGHFDLFNIRYAILPNDMAAPRADARVVQTEGRFRLWEIPTLGYFSGGSVAGPPIRSARDQMATSMRPYLAANPLDTGRITPVDFEGADHTLPSTTPASSARPVFPLVNQRADLERGRITGLVSASEPGYGLLRVSYHPRWRLLIDGEPAEYFMAAPAVMGFRVPEGDHEVVFEYEPIPNRLPMIVMGIAVAASLLALNQRRERKLKGSADHEASQH